MVMANINSWEIGCQSINCDSAVKHVKCIRVAKIESNSGGICVHIVSGIISGDNLNVILGING